MQKKINCAVCGQPFITCAKNAKYCPDCRAEVYRAASRERDRKKRAQRSSLRNETRQGKAAAQKQTPKPAATGPAIKTVDSYCKGCVYLAVISCDATKHRACNYIGETGLRRPCPAGKGCTVRKTGKRKASCVLPVR